MLRGARCTCELRRRRLGMWHATRGCSGGQARFCETIRLGWVMRTRFYEGTDGGMAWYGIASGYIGSYDGTVGWHLVVTHTPKSKSPQSHTSILHPLITSRQSDRKTNPLYIYPPLCPYSQLSQTKHRKQICPLYEPMNPTPPQIHPTLICFSVCHPGPVQVHIHSSPCQVIYIHPSL